MNPHFSYVSEPESVSLILPSLDCFLSQNRDSSNSDAAIISEFRAISDGGSMLDIIPLDMAKSLLKEGLIKRIEQEINPFPVRFGKKGAVSNISLFIRGNGLLDKIYVSDDLPIALISDVTLTSKGVTIVKQEFELWGLSKSGRVFFYGYRPQDKLRRSLWYVNFLRLLRATDPSTEQIK